MTWLDGIFRCSPLGENDCVVWWDALAAGGAWAAVIVAIAALLVGWVGIVVAAGSAYAVWRLGREANRLAEVPSQIAGREASQERVVLLSALYGETMVVGAAASAWHELVREEFGIAHMLDNEPSRREAAKSLRTLDMPLTKSVMGRLHVLPKAESSAFAQCLGIISVLHASAESLEMAGRGTERAEDVIERQLRDTKKLDELANELSILCEQQIYASQRTRSD
ncbi:TPA: hypothetical protein UMY79_004356 [Stenotrophomonas maltophilia]|nr:hypothetical protein [Stenotrophomonas maltophilia]HEL3817424.1 hypothetical protein [Stenotrophomonas maltophilia]